MRARTRHGRSTRDKGTVYLGKSSRRWAFKFYNKGREVNSRSKGHQIPFELEGKGLEEFSLGKLRAELRLFAKELEERYGITHGYHLVPEKLDHLFNTYLGKIDMSQQATLIDQQLHDMPLALRSSYFLWREGADLRGVLPHNTFYRHRRGLLEYGIDINLMHDSPEHCNVVPLIRVIEAKPVPIPQWAYDRGLIAL